MSHRKKENKLSWRKRKKMSKIVQELCSEVNTPATMHCFTVTEGFDESIEVRFQRKHEFKCQFENYIGIQSFTAYNKSKSRRNKKKTQREVCQCGEDCCFISCVRGFGRFLLSCIVSVWKACLFETNFHEIKVWRNNKIK